MKAVRPEHDQPAFVMEADDRFHSIVVSEGIRFQADPDAETVITFFVVRRANGTFDIANVTRTFRDDECVSRNVQSKQGIPADRIDAEVDDIERVFGAGIKAATGYRIKWHRLDLSKVPGMADQVSRIRAWGRVRAWTEADGAPVPR